MQVGEDDDAFDAAGLSLDKLTNPTMVLAPRRVNV